jgi:hypothetical protein
MNDSVEIGCLHAVRLQGGFIIIVEKQTVTTVTMAIMNQEEVLWLQVNFE